jgi:cell division protein FtsI (penicillin-binding protein 3)
LIGFSNEADQGVAGIEQSQDDILHGAVIKRYQKRDRFGRVYDEEVAEREAPGDVILTIDSAYQYMVEQALEKGVKQANAKSGIAVVLNAKTGEILALANYPTFDPNTINSKTAVNINNNAIQSVYSPGSTFKLVTYGAGLEKRLFNATDMISAGNGTIEVADHVFTDSHAVGTVSYSQAMAHSSNVCAIKTAMGVGREDFASMVKKMGFGAKSGVELPAETAGIVRPLEKWNGDSLASMSIGYEIGVTALQMTSAFATIANDGVRIKPRIIREVRRSGEAPPQTTQPEQTQVVTKETARQLRTMLKQVVLTGTGRRAQLNGYSAAGKTGTAWKVNTKSRSVDSSKYISSFIGMAPADDPEIAIGVIMDEPKGGARDGGMVSAPVFSDIAQRLLHEMRVPTDAPIQQETETTADIPEVPAADRNRVAATDAKPAARTAEPRKQEPPRDKKAKSKAQAVLGRAPDLSFDHLRRKVDVAT